MKPATTTWFSARMKLEEALTLASTKGYRVVEIAGTRENLKFDPIETRRILRKQSLELTCVSVGVPFSQNPSALNLHSQDHKTRRESVNYVFECIDYASKLGARFVYVCSIIQEQTGQSRSDASILFKESLDSCVEYGEKCGVLVALEPFPWGIYPSIYDAFHLVSQVNGAGLVFDIGHEALCRRPVSLSLHNPDMIFDVHVNNNDGENDKHWSPEKGIIQQAEYRNTIKQLRSMGYNGSITLELATIEGSELPGSTELANYIGLDA